MFASGHFFSCSSHHYAARLSVSYLAIEEESVAIVTRMVFQAICHLNIPDRYSFRLARACEALSNVRHFSEELGEEVIEKHRSFCFNNATQYLYRTIDFSHLRLNIVVVCVVGSDGMGDYHHMLNGAARIQSAFPKAKITLGTEVQDFENRRDKFTQPKFPEILWDRSSRLPANNSQISKCIALVKAQGFLIRKT